MSTSMPKGVFDLLPEPLLLDQKERWRSVEIWQWVERSIRELCDAYGYEEIRTPVFEKTELFQRGVGETSDIVTKEMYTFQDNGKRSLTLRPEGTAPIMRAALTGKFTSQSPVSKLFYLAPMFRYERPQAGRFRQHHQFGVEILGVPAPEQDAEVISFLCQLYAKLGLKNLRVQINSLGSPKSRQAYRQALIDYLEPLKDQLSEDSRTRLTKNPLRVLDSKAPEDQEAVKGAPSILDHLEPDCLAHFEKVKQLLTQMGVDYEVNHRLVRGLDYYNRTVFEVVTEDLGAQNSLGGGGRYDGLLKTLGGPDLPAIGFGMGMERVIQALLRQKEEIYVRKNTFLYLIPLGEAATSFCFSSAKQLRDYGISTQVDYTGRKLKKVMSHANWQGVEYVAVIGDAELEQDQFKLRNMNTGEEVELLISELLFEMLYLEGQQRSRELQQLASDLNEAIDQDWLQKKESQSPNSSNED